MSQNLGEPSGVFRLHSSDSCVGSWLVKDDVAEILGVSVDSLGALPFLRFGCEDIIDERLVQRVWYAKAIAGAPKPKVGSATVSFDELLLSKLIRLAYPNAELDHQIPWGRKRIDLKVSVGGSTKLVEFHGPQHFAPSRFNLYPPDPRERKQAIEDHFGLECVIWPYWVQRCVANARVLFEKDSAGLGVIWSAKVHFGDFVFPDSAEIIEETSARFNILRRGSYGYIYEGFSEGRNNPEHPCVTKASANSKLLARLLPKGYINVSRWLPEQLLPNEKPAGCG